MSSDITAHYDVVVIGAGPSGYAAAMRALDYQKKVAIVDPNGIGGAGIKNGALSSKTWWELARDVSSLHKYLYRFNYDTSLYPMAKINFSEIKREVDAAIKERIGFLQEHLEKHQDDHNKSDIHQLRAWAKIIENHKVEISYPDGHQTHISADYIIIATGSSPRKLPSIPIDEKAILTSDGIENLQDYPKSMVVLGAGVIGCEYATIFSNLGHTKVFLIDKGDRILPFEDEDVVRVIERNLERNGVIIHRNSQLVSMTVNNGEVEYKLKYDDGAEQTCRVEKALVSVGRVANTKNLWSENVSISANERGNIIDNDTQTSVSNIYAVGDVTADISLVNVGELEGRYAIERIYGSPKHKLIYQNISTIMFLNPEVAGVGLNEIQAQEKGIPYRVVSLDYSCIPRAVAMRNTQGFIKILVTDDDEMKILGMRVVGQHASSAIQAVALLISMDKGITELAELIHPHPSIIEGIQECARMLMGKSSLKPDLVGDKVVFKTFRPEATV